MKSFKDLINEGGEMYPADDMTINELKIACYAAQNILDRLESGGMVQRWQISAIVKAKEELSSVYTSMSADDQEDDMWDEEDEPMYVGYEYPGMYEAVDKNHPIVKEYRALKKRSIKELRGMIAQQSRISDTSEFRTKDHAATHILRSKHGHKKVAAAFGLNEEVEQIDEAATKYVVKGKSPFYKQDHYINTHETPKAQLIKKNIKHATRMDLETAKKVAKDWESHPNKYKTEVVPVNEEADLDENIAGRFKNASEWESAAKSRGLVVKSMTHPSGETTKYQIAKDKQGNNRGHFDHGTKSGHLKEEVDLDENYGTAVKKAEAARQRALKKAASMVKKGFSHEAAAKNHDVKVDDLKRHMNEEADFKVSVEGLPKMFVKAKSESDAKTKLRKVVKNPDMIKDVERVNASDVKKTFRDFLSGKKEVEEETDLEEADGTKRNRELLATGRISKDEFDKRMGYGKYKKTDNSKKLDGPGGVYKNLVKRLGEENLEESPAEMKKAALDVKKVYNGGGKPPHYVVVRGATGLKAFDNEADARAHRDHLKRQEEMKEELDEAVTVNKKNYSWGKMVTVHHGSSHSYPLHPEHQEKIKNLKDGESTSFKDETGTHVTAHREGDKIHLGQKKVNAKTTVARSHFTEEVNLDEADGVKGWKNAASDISKWRSAQGKNVKLVSLKKDGNENKMPTASKTFRSEDEAQEHHDRVTKLNPKMKIRHNMYVDGKHVKTLGEGVELDEVSASTLRSYIDKAKEDKSKQKKAATVAKNDMKKYGMTSDRDRADAAQRKASNRNTGMSVAKKKLGMYPKDRAQPKVMATEETNLDEAESWEAGYKRRVVKTTKPEHKEKGYNWRIKGKERPEISIKLYKEKPSQEEFNKQMKRVAGHEFGG